MAADLQTQLTDTPVVNRATFEEFELLFKQRFTEVVVKETVEFLDQFNPVPDPVSEFLTTSVLDVPGLNELLVDIGVGELTPENLLRTFAGNTGHPEVGTVLDGLGFFFELNTLQNDPLLSSPSTDLSDYDMLFDRLDTGFDVDLAGLVSVDLALPIVGQFNQAKMNAGANPAELAALAEDLTTALDTLQGTGLIGSAVLDFDFAGDVSTTIFSITPRIPVFAVTAPGFAAGATLGGSIGASIRYAIDGAIGLSDGLTVNNGEMAVGLGLTGDGSVGLSIAGFTINAATLSATVSGELGMRLSPALDTNGVPGLQPEEFLGQSCYFDTFGGIRFRADASYLDPDPVNQFNSITSSGQAAERSVNLFNELLWSADLSSCDPAVRGAAAVAEVEGDVLEITGTAEDDVITVTLDEGDPTDPILVVDKNGEVREIPLATVEINTILIEGLAGADTITIDPDVLIDAEVHGGTGDDNIQGGGGNDLILGEEGNDELDAGPGDDHLLAGPGDDTLIATAGADILEGGEGSDRFSVAPDPFWNMSVAGGPPVAGDADAAPGDVLLVDLTGVAGASVPRNVTAGTIDSLSHGAIHFTEIEALIASDRLERNDTRQIGTDLGSEPAVTLRDLSIHSNTQGAQDVDFFRLTAHETGKLVVEAHFEHVVGDLDMNVRDAEGSPIAQAASLTDDERLVIPVVAGQTYYIEVFGFTEEDVNNYSLDVENFPAPVPTAVVLDPFNDTGVFNNDQVTSDATPQFFIQADLHDFEQMGIKTDLDPQAPGPGADVILAITNVDNGQIVELDAERLNAILWRATPINPLPAGRYLVQAATLIADGQTTRTVGRSAFSPPLWLTIDAHIPFVSFGEPGVVDGLVAESDTGVATEPGTFNDRITSDTTPTFWGRAEAQATVRLYVDTNDNGAVDLGTDVFLGQTTALPFGENPLFTDGYWEITSVVDLNDLPGLPRDGLRQILATAEDYVGNVNLGAGFEGEESDQVLEIFLDTQGPQISGVHVSDFPEYDLFDPKPSENGPTPAVNSLLVSITDMPPRLDPGFPYHAVQQEIAASPGHYRLVGDRVGNVPVQNVHVHLLWPKDGLPAAALIELTFDRPLADDRYTFTVSDSLLDPAGNRLDGESNAAQPLESPSFPTGDGIRGGAFEARFTIDSHPELGAYVPEGITIDINGNHEWDPGPPGSTGDATNVDLTFTLTVADPATGNLAPGGYNVHDLVFAGEFAGPLFTLDGEVREEQGRRLFDQLAAFGFAQELDAGQAIGWRWLVDTNSDGVINTNDGDRFSRQSLLDGFFDIRSAIPVAGDFDQDPTNGDEIGLYRQGQWLLDTNHDFVLDSRDTLVKGNLLGHPVVGDFDGDGLDDLATFNNNVWSFDLAAVSGWGNGVDDTLAWGFPGVMDRPVATDMDQDGIDDIGMWVPRNSSQLNRPGAEWFFLVSDDFGANRRLDGRINTLDHPFEPIPFGSDIFAEFGDERALPIVGNFDPPVSLASEQPGDDGVGSGLEGDLDNNGLVNQGDLDLVLLHWGTRPGAVSPGLDADELIDQEELDAVLLNWGRRAPQAPSPAATQAAEAFEEPNSPVTETSESTLERIRRPGDPPARFSFTPADAVFFVLGRAEAEKLSSSLTR